MFSKKHSKNDHDLSHILTACLPYDSSPVCNPHNTNEKKHISVKLTKPTR